MKITYSEFNKKNSDLIISILSVYASFGMVTINAIASNYEVYSYRFGIVFTIIFILTLSKVRFIYAVISSILILVIFNILNVFYPSIPIKVLNESNIIFCFTILLGGVSSYYVELLDRKQFKFLHLLEQEKNNVIAANHLLEEKINERTQLLFDSNKLLIEANSKLTSSEYSFRKLFEDSSDALLLIENQHIMSCNQATVNMFKYSGKSELIGKTPWDLSPEYQLDRNTSEQSALMYFQRLESEKNVAFQWMHTKKDKSVFPTEINMTMILVNGKKVIHVLLKDVTKRFEMEKRLEYLSYHDQLTGIYNRRFFEEELDRLNVARNLPISVIVADVNGLKLLNDAFGHLLGDQLLVSVADVMRQGCRTGDIIARLGTNHEK